MSSQHFHVHVVTPLMKKKGLGKDLSLFFGECVMGSIGIPRILGVCIFSVQDL